MMRRTGAILVVGCLLAAACGGDDAAETDDDPTRPTTSEPTTSAATDPAATDPPSTEPPTSDPPATDPPTTEPSTTDPAAAEPVTIISEDGQLAITVGADDAARVDPSIRILDPSDWPPELAGSEASPGVVIYELEPDGAEFDEPVTVTRRLDIADLDVEVDDFDVLVANLLTRSATGEYELLDDIKLVRMGRALFVSGSTTHFSPVIGAASDAVVRLPEPEVSISFGADDPFAYYDDVEPGDLAGFEYDPDADFLEGTHAVLDNGLRAGPDLDQQWEAAMTEARAEAEAEERLIAGAVAAVANELDNPLIAKGDGLFELSADFPEVPARDLGGAALLSDEAALETVNVYAAIILFGEDGGSITERLDLIEAMAGAFGFDMEVVHSLFGPFPSFTRKRLTGLPELPADMRLYSATFSSAGGEPSLVDLVPMEWDGEGYGAEAGLLQYGPISEAVVLTRGELSSELVDPNGPPIGTWDDLTNSDALEGRVRLISTESGEVQVFDVGADEGPLFGGDVLLRPEGLP